MNLRADKPTEINVGQLVSGNDVGRIKVTGYDTGLPLDDLYTALAEHFSSCGEIWEIYIPLKFDETNTILNRFWWLLPPPFLSNSSAQVNVGGWNVSVEAYPYPAHANDSVRAVVHGKDVADTVTQLNGSYMRGRKLAVLGDCQTGNTYTPHSPPRQFQ
ncbi:unnamed protein product [Arabidopsis thaliana]|nr:unnamed protein product [Arabidopsis thaliana]